MIEVFFICLENSCEVISIIVLVCCSMKGLIRDGLIDGLCSIAGFAFFAFDRRVGILLVRSRYLLLRLLANSCGASSSMIISIALGLLLISITLNVLF